MIRRMSSKPQQLFGLWLTLCVYLLLINGVQNSSYASHAAPATRETPTSLTGQERKQKDNAMEEVFRTAITSVGEDYLEAEQALRAGGADALMAMQQGLGDGDPIAPLLVQVLTRWIEQNPPEYQAALDYLDFLPQKLARTPIPKPSPSGVAAYLTKHFAGNVTDVLALRLIKAIEWPHWRVAGVLLYFQEHKDPQITAALIRFAGQASDRDWRNLAIETIRATSDPNIGDKLASERQFYHARHEAYPAHLGVLEAN